MQFLRLIFVKKLQLQLQGASPPGPPLGAFCGPQAPTFHLTFPFLIPMPGREERLAQTGINFMALLEVHVGREERLAQTGINFMALLEVHVG